MSPSPSCARPRLRLGSKSTQPRRRRRATKRKFNPASGAVSKDVYQRVTDRIIADLAKGVTPWIKPWDAGNTEGRIIRPLRHNGVPYRGINVLLLWSAALEHGFTSPNWITFKQAEALGAHVRKGERGSLVVYAKTFEKTETGNDGVETTRDVPFLRGYTVFSVEQVEGLPEQYRARPPPQFTNTVERVAHADEFFRNTGATIITRGGRALYSGGSDHILMPPIESFFDTERYYSTLAHETIHWTKHSTRLSRDFGRKTFGDPGYALEEIVAEMGAAFLCDHLEISPVLPDDHAAYIASWILALQDDKHAIFKAASFAQKAVDYLVGLQPGGQAPEPDADLPAVPVPDPSA